MTHLSSTLPDRIELGALRTEDWGTEVVTTDGGLDIRNNRWNAPLRSYDIALPPTKRDDADYVALRDLFAEAEGGLHSFDFLDWSDGVTVAVRFDTPLRITGMTPDDGADKGIDHIDTFTLVEVKDPTEAES